MGCLAGWEGIAVPVKHDCCLISPLHSVSATTTWALTRDPHYVARSTFRHFFSTYCAARLRDDGHFVADALRGGVPCVVFAHTVHVRARPLWRQGGHVLVCSLFITDILLPLLSPSLHVQPSLHISQMSVVPGGLPATFIIPVYYRHWGGGGGGGFIPTPPRTIPGRAV